MYIDIYNNEFLPPFSGIGVYNLLRKFTLIGIVCIYYSPLFQMKIPEDKTNKGNHFSL